MRDAGSGRLETSAVIKPHPASGLSNPDDPCGASRSTCEIHRKANECHRLAAPIARLPQSERAELLAMVREIRAALPAGLSRLRELVVGLEGRLEREADAETG